MDKLDPILFPWIKGKNNLNSWRKVFKPTVEVEWPWQRKNLHNVGGVPWSKLKTPNTIHLHDPIERSCPYLCFVSVGHLNIFIRVTYTCNNKLWNQTKMWQRFFVIGQFRSGFRGEVNDIHFKFMCPESAYKKFGPFKRERFRPFKFLNICEVG